MDIVSGIRTIRKDNNIAFKVVIEMHVIENNKIDRMFDPVLVKLGNIEQLIYSNDKPQNAFSFVVKNNEYFVPFNDNVDLKGERNKILEELSYARGFLKSVQKKLANERFVNNAPEQVVDTERRKESDAISKIKILEEKLERLG